MFSSRRIRIAALVMTPCLLVACNSSPSTPVGDPDMLRIQIAASADELRADPATIDSAAIAGDVLQLHLTHGGGCRTHVFGLHTSGVFLESEPVQVPVQLSHDADNDMCRALVRPVVRFDLTALRELYKKSYGKGGTMVLQVKAPGADGATTSVGYDVK